MHQGGQAQAPGVQREPAQRHDRLAVERQQAPRLVAGRQRAGAETREQTHERVEPRRRQRRSRLQATDLGEQRRLDRIGARELDLPAALRQACLDPAEQPGAGGIQRVQRAELDPGLAGVARQRLEHRPAGVVELRQLGHRPAAADRDLQPAAVHAVTEPALPRSRCRAPPSPAPGAMLSADRQGGSGATRR